jgi:hypothetical protein
VPRSCRWMDATLPACSDVCAQHQRVTVGPLRIPGGPETASIFKGPDGGARLRRAAASRAADPVRRPAMRAASTARAGRPHGRRTQQLIAARPAAGRDRGDPSSDPHRTAGPVASGRDRGMGRSAVPSARSAGVGASASIGAGDDLTWAPLLIGFCCSKCLRSPCSSASPEGRCSTSSTPDGCRDQHAGVGVEGARRQLTNASSDSSPAAGLERRRREVVRASRIIQLHSSEWMETGCAASIRPWMRNAESKVSTRRP